MVDDFAMAVKPNGKHNGHYGDTDKANYKTLDEPSDPMQPVVHANNFQCLLQEA